MTPLRACLATIAAAAAVAVSGPPACGATATITDPLRKAIDQAVAKVKPALVQIHVVAVDYSDGREKKDDEYGSGVIIDKRGFILTNHHVAGHPARLFCILPNQEEIEAELVGTDPAADIAVIRLKTDVPREFPCAAFGDSSRVRVGDRVLAMGSPISISQSVTLGIISNTEMVMPRLYEKYGFLFLMDGEDVGSLVRWLAHDAAIYGGNSGGPLVNLRGEIIGVNELSLGLGGAIPANTARAVAEQIMQHGSVTRAWLGLETQTQLKNAALRKGVLVGGVISGSPAEQAGFQPGDLLVRLDGKEVEARFREQLPLFHQVVADLPIGRVIEAVALRQGAEKLLKVTPVRREPMEPPTSELKAWGITVRNLSLLAAKEMKRDNRDGVLVTSLRPGGPCGQAKPPLEERDVIVRVAGQAVTNVEQLVALSRQLTAGKQEPEPVLVAFERTAEQYVTVVKVGIQETEDLGAELKKAWLDAATQVLTRDTAEQMGLPGRTGVRLTDVYKGGKAEQAGLRAGDLIVAVDGERIAASNPEDVEVFPAMIRQYQIGAVVKLSIIRDGQAQQIPVELVRAPLRSSEMKKYRSESFEFTVRDVAFLDRIENKWAPSERGVYVSDVVPGGWAAIGNLNVDDLILEVGREKIGDVAAFEQAMKRVEAEKPPAIVFHVLRGIHHLYVELEPDWARHETAGTPSS